MSTEPVSFTQEEWLEFRLKFSELKHSINNALAVFMALAELSQRNPDNYQKLAQSVCTRTPELARTIQDFSIFVDLKTPAP